MLKVGVKIAVQLNKYLQADGLMPRLQSVYRHRHSTETALLRVLSNIYAAADRREVTLLSLLDMRVSN